MLRYLNSDIVFQEVPDEVVLAINLTGCPCHCPGCHSPYLWEERGDILTDEALDGLIGHYQHDITCVALMGGDADPKAVDLLAHHVRQCYPQLHTAWYSGRSLLSPAVTLHNFDYIKLGPYIRHLGALRSKRTNQRFYKVVGDVLQDITERFWSK